MGTRARARTRSWDVVLLLIQGGQWQRTAGRGAGRNQIHRVNRGLGRLKQKSHAKLGPLCPTLLGCTDIICATLRDVGVDRSGFVLQSSRYDYQR